MQVIDTSRSVDVSLMDGFWQYGKSSEGFGIGSSCGILRKGAFSEDLFGEVEDSRIAEKVQTGTEVEFTEEVYDQMNQENYRAALRKYEHSGFGKLPTEDKIIDRSVESFGTDEHHAMGNDYILSPENEELSGEQSDDDYWFEDISDTDFSDVEELDVNDARSETSIAVSLNSVACDNVTAIAINFAVGVKARRNDMLGAWRLMELKTRKLDQKFRNVTHVAD